MGEQNNNKRRNGPLSLYPLKFEEAVKGFLEVKPEEKRNPKTKDCKAPIKFDCLSSP